MHSKESRTNISSRRIAVDLRMQSYKNEYKEPIWDFMINEDTGELELMPDELSEEGQRAVVAAFTQRGSIPQLPEVGVQWAELLTEMVGASEVNAQVVNAIQTNADTFAYLPVYSKQDGKLLVEIKEVGQ